MQPPANNLKITKEEPDMLFPLAVNHCKDCHHSQLTVAVDRDILYKHYLYVSGTSQTLRDEFYDVADMIVHESYTEGRKVLDIACNDGTFLRSFRQFGWEAYGIDPAENLVSEISDSDLHVKCDYFPVKDPFGTKFDAITCFNVVAHVPNPLEFLKGCKDLLVPGGKIYIQTSQREMVKNGEFDTIYHEHHSFFSISSMNALCKRAGLILEDVRERPVHGKSYLFVIGHPNALRDNQIDKLIEQEAYTTMESTYEDFTNKVLANKQRLLDIINTSKHKVVGYGAAAKGVVMSNYVGRQIDYIVDENPLKIGKVIGGVNIPIVGPDKLLEEAEDLTIIVYAWNFYDEVYKKIKHLRPNNNDLILRSFEK
jgi:SAM-dependent methyltransferase